MYTSLHAPVPPALSHASHAHVLSLLRELRRLQSGELPEPLSTRTEVRHPVFGRRAYARTRAPRVYQFLMQVLKFSNL